MFGMLLIEQRSHFMNLLKLQNLLIKFTLQKT